MNNPFPCPTEEQFTGYEAQAQALKARILALIPDNPGIMQMTSCWDLFNVPGFVCNDLSPTFAMATEALATAKRKWYDSHANHSPATHDPGPPEGVVPGTN